MQVPWNALSEEALLGLIEEYVLREGTDYGAVEVELETKVRTVLVQVENGEVGVFFDAETGTTTLELLDRGKI